MHTYIYIYIYAQENFTSMHIRSRYSSSSSDALGFGQRNGLPRQLVPHLLRRRAARVGRQQGYGVDAWRDYFLDWEEETTSPADQQSGEEDEAPEPKKARRVSPAKTRAEDKGEAPAYRERNSGQAACHPAAGHCQVLQGQGLAACSTGQSAASCQNWSCQSQFSKEAPNTPKAAPATSSTGQGQPELYETLTKLRAALRTVGRLATEADWAIDSILGRRDA